MTTLRTVLGVIVGAIVAFTLVAVTENAGHQLYPVPAGIDWSDADQTRVYMQNLPMGATLMLLLAWIGATFVGGIAGSLIARPRAVLISAIVGGLVLAATVMNFLMIPHPIWLIVIAVPGIVVAAWAAGKLLRKPVATGSA